MSTIPTDAPRQFTHLSRAWYGEVCLRDTRYTDAITFGLYNTTGGGCYAEMQIQWIPLGNRDQPCPELRVFDDAWAALPMFADLFTEPAKLNNTNPTPEQVTAVLLACGFEDDTEETGDKR